MEPSLHPAQQAVAGNSRTPTVKTVGEPCAGEPHARFHGEGLETDRVAPRQSITQPTSGAGDRGGDRRVDPGGHPAPVQTQGFPRQRHEAGAPTYESAAPGHRSAPGSWCSAVTPSSSTRTPTGSSTTSGALVDGAPNPVRWVVLDASSLDDIDYSASVSLAGLLDYLDAKAITFALARADTGLLYTWQPAG